MLHGDVPRRTKESEVHIMHLDVSGAAAGRLIRREVEWVGDSMATRERRTRLKERRRRGQAIPLVALTHDDNLRTGRDRGTYDAVDEKHCATSNPLAFDEEFGWAREPGANLEGDTRGLSPGRGRIKLGVDYARGARRIGGMTQSSEEDGVTLDERRQNLDCRVFWCRRPPRGRQKAGLRLGPLIGRQHPLDLLGAAVAPGEELQAGHPEGARTGKIEYNHPAARAEIVKPMPRREAGDAAGRLEDGVRRREIHVKVFAGKGEAADHLSALDDIAASKLTQIGEGD